MEIDFSAEDGEPRYSFESCGADTDADGVVTFEVCGAPMIVRQGGELGERLWASDPRNCDQACRRAGRGDAP